MWRSVLRTLAAAVLSLLLGFVLPASWSLSYWALRTQPETGSLGQTNLWLGLLALAMIQFLALRSPALREPIGQCLGLLTIFLAMLLVLASVLPVVSTTLVSRAGDLLLLPGCVLPAALLSLLLRGWRAGLDRLGLLLLPCLPYFAALALCAGLFGLAPGNTMLAAAAGLLLLAPALAFARPAALARAYGGAPWLPVLFHALGWLLLVAALIRLTFGLTQGQAWSVLRAPASVAAAALAATALSAVLAWRLECRTPKPRPQQP
ncbi:MAG: hypothetical protein EYC70_15835 [Planctomycetota bacterium]|nr:MAG: hypothetical protein EYC70_15835 [Planctomycetota bacterium]